MYKSLKNPSVEKWIQKGKFENLMGLLGATPKAQKTGAETAVLVQDCIYTEG